ncbi:MAG: tetratricopeptide repeat protein [Candidatus Omnitrophica bacterium]|nr:tetratricopeptide repeat protein [Candidatus Omnitrophota bacterium]
MGKHGAFPVLRKKLDDAITYGTKKDALRLAKEGLRRSIKARLVGEEEYFRGQVEIVRGRYSYAIEHFDAAIRHNPFDGAAYNDRALCMVELGVLEGALEYFDKGIEAEPDYATVYHNKGWFLNNIGRHTQALACFEKTLELEPGRAVTYDNLADALLNLGDLAGALRAYKKVLKLLKPGSCRGIRKNIKQQMRTIEKLLSDERDNHAKKG